MAAKQRLNSKLLDGLKPTSKREAIADEAVTGLKIIVHPTGKKVWTWFSKVKGKTVKLTLGRYPEHSLVAAREWAGNLNDQKLAGTLALDKVDDAEDDEAPAEAAAPSVPMVAVTVNGEERQVIYRSVTWMFEMYMIEEGNAKKTAKEKRQIFEREVKPSIGDKCIDDVEHDDLAGLVRAKKAVAPGASNNLCIQIKRLFSWGASDGRDITKLKEDPARYVKKMAPVNERDRHFDGREISLFFKWYEQSDSFLKEGLMLILYTGVRRSEAFEAPWAEFRLDDSMWIIPKERTKNSMEHVLPVPAEVVNLVRRLHNSHGGTPWVFPGVESVDDGEDAVFVNTFQKQMNAIRDEIAEMARKEGFEMEHWTIHDLRRTLSSGMNAILDEDDMPKIDPDTVERVINHKIGGVKGVYNRYQYFAPKKRALRLWADRLAELGSPLALSDPLDKIAA